MRPQTMQHMPTHDMHYFDYASYKDLSRDKLSALHGLVRLYQSIFSETDGWGERYSYEEVRANLIRELAGHARIRICVDRNNDDEVIGFFWAQQLSLQNVCETIKTVQYYRMIGSPELHQTLGRVMPDEPVIYLHDLGIKRSMRGKLALNQLISPVLRHLTAQTGITKVLFWTIADTHVSKLAKRAGLDLILIHSGMQFYSGDVTRAHRCAEAADRPSA